MAENSNGEQPGEGQEGQGSSQGGTTPRPEEGHQFSQGLQRLQQRQGNVERQLNQAVETIKELKDTLSQGTAAQKKQAGNINDALNNLGEEDVVDASTFKKAFDGLQEQVQEQVKSAINESLSDVKGHVQESRTEKWWNQWRNNHPDLAGKEDDLIAEAENIVSDNYGSALEGDAYRTALQVTFDHLTREREKEAKQSSGKKEEEKPSASPPEEPPAKTEPSGSTSKGSSESGKPRKPGRLWIPPDEEGS